MSWAEEEVRELVDDETPNYREAKALVREAIRETIREAARRVRDVDQVEAKGDTYYAQLGDAAATREACALAVEAMLAGKAGTPAGCGVLMALPGGGAVICTKPAGHSGLHGAGGWPGDEDAPVAGHQGQGHDPGGMTLPEWEVALRWKFPHRARILPGGNAYGLPAGKEFLYARRKDGDASPFPIEVYSVMGDYRIYQLREDEVQLL